MVKVNLFAKQKQRHKRRQQVYGCQREEGGGGESGGAIGSAMSATHWYWPRAFAICLCGD